MELNLDEVETLGRQVDDAFSGRNQAAKQNELSKEQQAGGWDEVRMQAAIEKALDKKLKPVMKLLVESKQSGPSLTEILGGIGYILGLVGIAAYFKSRQKTWLFDGSTIPTQGEKPKL